jgi:hypothetical protein
LCLYFDIDKNIFESIKKYNIYFNLCIDLE